MPNWCSNTATFTHEDPEQIQRLIKAAMAGKLFNEFLPCPPELLEEVPIGDDYVQRRDALIARNQELHGYDSWYEWNVDNWGTKWDIGEVDEDCMVKNPDGKSVSFSFDTAWAPPLGFYDDIEFTVEAYYHEPGMGFCGKWTTEDGDAYYEVSSEQSIEDIENSIPSDILETFNIIDDIRDWQESLAEEDEDELGDIDDAEDSEHDSEQDI